MRRALLCLAALVACDDGADPQPLSAADAAPPLRMPTPYLPEIADPPPVAGLDPAALNAAVAEHLPRMARASVSALPELIEALIAFDDPACPRVERFGEGDAQVLTAEGECVTRDGVSFRGYLGLRRFAGHGDDGAPIEGFVIDAGEVRIAAPDGRALELTGYLEFNRTTHPDETSEGTWFEGLFRADPATAADHPWLGPSGPRQMGRYRGLHASGNVWFELSTVAGFDDGPLSAIKIDGLRINTWACTEEPAGAIAVREANGLWHDLLFDGFAEDEDAGDAAPDGCDGCGIHLFGGEAGAALCDAAAWFEPLLAEARR